MPTPLTKQPSTLLAAEHTAPIFPNFKPLELSDRQAIEAFTSQFAPYSDFCFSTLFFYDFAQKTRWCWLNSNLVLCLHDEFSSERYLTFLGNQKTAATADELITYAKRKRYSPVLQRMPETTIRALAEDHSHFGIEPERDAFDYVYDLSQLADLTGTAKYTLRHNTNRFKARYPRHDFAALDLGDQSVVMRIKQLISAWHPAKGNSNTAQAYSNAFGKCMEHVLHLELVTIGALIDGSLVGITIAYRKTDHWLLSHFAITDPAVAGLSASLLHYLAQHSVRLGYRHLNYQEDLGDAGLRHFKKHCAPSHFLKKFTVQQLLPRSDL